MTRRSRRLAAEPSGLAVSAATGITLTPFPGRHPRRAESYTLYRSATEAGTYDARQVPGSRSSPTATGNSPRPRRLLYKCPRDELGGRKRAERRGIGHDGLRSWFSTLARLGEPGCADGTGASSIVQESAWASRSTPPGHDFTCRQSKFYSRKITQAGKSFHLAGTAGNYGSTDSSGGSPMFEAPTGIAVDSIEQRLCDGDQQLDHQEDHAFEEGKRPWPGSGRSTGSADGTGSAARFKAPTASPSLRRESSTSRTTIITPSGRSPPTGPSPPSPRQVGAYGKRGRARGNSATFWSPANWLGPSGEHLRCDWGSLKIRKVTPGER
jgi:hypothetical protein